MFPGGYGGIRGYVLVNWLVESFGDSSPGGKESREVPDVFPGGDGGGKGVHPLMNSFLGLLETNPLVEKNLEMLQIMFPGGAGGGTGGPPLMNCFLESSGDSSPDGK
jgi:hypothetical protein